MDMETTSLLSLVTGHKNQWNNHETDSISLRYRSSDGCIPCTLHVIVQYNCTLFNRVPRNTLPKQLEQMRSLSVMIAMLVSSTVMGQAYSCGMFGMIADDYSNGYIGRFDLTLDSVQLESMNTCDIFKAPIEVWDIKNRKNWTIIWMDIQHPDFDMTGYKIKYPTGSWQVIRQRNDVLYSDEFWPLSPLD